LFDIYVYPDYYAFSRPETPYFRVSFDELSHTFATLFDVMDEFSRSDHSTGGVGCETHLSLGLWIFYQMAELTIG